MILTFQDFEKADDKKAFVLRAIGVHKNSKQYKLAKMADDYDAQRNTTITNVTKTIYDANGVEVDDFTASNTRIASNFFNRLNTQRCMYSLGNGVNFIDPHEAADGQTNDETKEALGKHFDHIAREAAYHALIHGRSYLFWNMDRTYWFKFTEFVGLVDEYDGTLRAGIRFWQIDESKPLNAVLYEEDGYTKYRTDKDGKLDEVQPKRAYKVKYQYTDAGDVLATEEENYTRLPIVTMYASRLKQSTLVGMREAIDAYDMISSGFANDLLDCAQVYWIVENYGGMSDDDLAQFIDRIKMNHIAEADTSSGGAIRPYTQDIPVKGREAFLTLIKNRIYDDFGALDVHTISAYSTNDHVDAAYQPMDENADDFEHWVGDAIEQLLLLQGIEDRPVFVRNKISNQKSQIEMVLEEAPYLDRATILRKLPNITYDEAQAILSSDEVLLAKQVALAQAMEAGVIAGQTPQQVLQQSIPQQQADAGDAEQPVV